MDNDVFDASSIDEMLKLLSKVKDDHTEYFDKPICTCENCLDNRIKGLRKYNTFIENNYVNHIIECIKSNNITPVIVVAESVAPEVCKYYNVSSTEEFFISYPLGKYEDGYLTIYKLIEGKKYVNSK